MSLLNRRELLVRSAAATAALSLSTATGWASRKTSGCTLSIGTYAMPGMELEKAIALISDSGYDGVEIAARADYDGAPATMPPARRRRVRGLLQNRGLRLTALMEHLFPAEKDSDHAAQLDRLKGVATLARDLAANGLPLVQTVLGGGQWSEKRNLFRDRLGDWLAVLGEKGVALAIKPHRGGAMSRPDEAVWLIRQLDTPAGLGMVYDYSHYAFRDMTVADTVALALPYTTHMAVKDAVRQGERIRFQLPGTGGTFDYEDLLRRFFAGGYRGDVCCEVSGMVSKAPGYDPAEAARLSYRNMARAFERAGIPRT